MRLKSIIWITLSIFFIVIFFRRCTYKEIKDRFFIKDKEGRSLILHGVNANPDAKSDSLRVGWPLEKDYADISKKWGFNFVRYLVLWDGIEPEKGKYDTSYFNRIKQRLDWCHKYDLKVVLDMHQDVYALRYGGDGAPEWAIRDNNEPFEMQLPWELNYRQPAVIASINNFWDTTRGHSDLQKHFIDSYIEMVKRFKNHPAVIGYDLYNEPTMATGEMFSFEKKYLKPFYEKLIKRIREVDNDNWIFFEPSALGGNQGLKSGLGVVKDYRKGNPKLVYFPHIYTIDLDIMDKYIGFPVFISFWAASREIEIKKQKSPLVVGEFGLNVTEPGADDYLRNLMKMFDKITSGWAYWAYMKKDKWSPFNNVNWSPFTDSKDTPHKIALDILVRPYPRCVSGHPESYGFDKEENKFWLEFEPDKNISAPTEIYIPKQDYPQGWELKVSINNKYWKKEWDEKRRILKLYFEKGLKDQNVYIEIIGI